MKKLLLAASTLFAFFLLLVSASAQTTTFTYQGRLTDQMTAASGAFDFEFRLFDTAGTQIGATVAREDVAVSNGVFTVGLDFGAAAFPGANRVLEIAVRRGAETGAFTALTPRQPVSSTPYAIRALNAGTADTATNATNAENATNATTATDFSGALSGDVSGTQNATNVGTVGGKTATQISTSVDETLNATDANTAGRIVKRDALGGFSAGLMTVTNTRLSLVTGNDGSALRIVNSYRDTIQQGIFAQFRSYLGAGTTLTDKFRFDQAGGSVAIGEIYYGVMPQQGAGYRMMWYPGKASFRIGGVSGEQWNEWNTGYYSFAGGYDTVASGNNSFAFGDGSKAQAPGSVSLGKNNANFDLPLNAEADNSFAVGENNNVCGYTGMTLGFGNNAGCSGNLIPGTSPTRTASNMSVAIGYRNVASGNYSMAMGKYASTNGFTGAFVWSDASNTNTDTAATNLFTATADNQFSVKASGGVRFYTKSDLSTGVTLSANGGSWTSVSDRNAKDNIVSVNPRDILKGVLKLPISTWNYKGQPEFRHIGAMAQDFYSTFKVGENDKTITTVDPDGVAFAAIQGLNDVVSERAARLEAENRALRTALGSLEARLKRLEQGAPVKRRAAQRRK